MPNKAGSEVARYLRLNPPSITHLPPGIRGFSFGQENREKESIRLINNMFRFSCLITSLEKESIRLINKKIISPSREEVRTNIRSRSARMRVAERI
ncbi:16S rRNA (cytosine(1402)-N(4))-methyltransferase [SAR202 cluster bacterium AC-647-N09_OGT_505m]|nr:16S rRNA (cytosine(1402)-N(4))-methyltransferase [SAR202 cluster bacterium AC-647-N09_OGT_505m]